MSEASPPPKDYQPAREPGEIVALKAIGLEGDIKTDAAKSTTVLLLSCRAGMGDEPYEDWVVEAVGGERDGCRYGAYVFKPGMEPKR